jgi:hypothetical protein
MNDDRIEGFVAGSIAVTVTTVGNCVSLTMDGRGLGKTEAIMPIERCSRLRRLLAAAEKRARQPQ